LRPAVFRAVVFPRRAVAVLRRVVLVVLRELADFRAGDFRAVDFRAVDFRAVDFRAVDLPREAVLRRVVDFRRAPPDFFLRD
jgi:uncharacterized protein YjbI with pentapeptide repeats